MTRRAADNPCIRAPHRRLFTRLLLAALLVMSPLLGQAGAQSATAMPGVAASADGGHPPCHGAGGAHDTERAAAAGCAHCDGGAPLPGCQCCDLGAPGFAPPPTATAAAPLADGRTLSSRLPDGMPPSPAKRLFRPPIATA